MTLLQVILLLLKLTDGLFKYLDQQKQQEVARKIVESEWMREAVEINTRAKQVRDSVTGDLAAHPDRVRDTDQFER